ncbi:MAG: hypothetical protein II903_01460 [Spirochaetales bacterium]|nr:hypothetical protein [Spirochaetales bacterium]
MKYSDLIEFEPITNVIQLKDADSPLFAADLVKTFVASKSMEDCFTKLIFPHLQFNHFNDNKALMIIGNYGTGKSHLMSVISAIAQDSVTVASLKSQVIKDAASEVAGKFKVVRVEAGAAQNSLDNIILKIEIEKKLADWKVNYRFPDFSSIASYKDCINDMMSAFSSKYPDQGVLIVIDELLEYLRSKDEHALFRDLGFFRQLAECCKDTKLRVIVGMQESVFDSPYFKFAGDTLNKIKDRTQIVSIKKDDIKYVVSERLLKKTADQKAQIREYLEKFKPYYSNLNANFEDFVSLFPLHPAYIDAFQRMVRVEKREVLKSVSNELKNAINNDVPEKNLELITIDRYWATVANDAALNAYEGIKEVKDCNVQLQNKVKLIKPASYIPIARKIIDALSVQRLESTDVSSPIGLTASELKDNLCLYNQMVKEMGDTEEDLLTIIEAALSAMMKAVNGQYIEKTPEGQYYINIQKTYDYDEVINAKIEQLTDDDLNNSFYSVLKLNLDVPEQSVFMANRIWDHELQFLQHKMYRKGWLFFGVPDERPTAVPEKDFYLFFVPPFKTQKYKDTGRSDELVFKFRGDAEFDEALRFFAATTSLSLTASQAYKATFQNKADFYRKKLSMWLSQHIFDAFTITHEDKTKTIQQWIVNVNLREITGISSTSTLTFAETFDGVCSYLLSPNFNAVAPEYPKFSIKFTESNIKTNVTDAIRCIATGNPPTNTAVAVLTGLGLMSNGTMRVGDSVYAKWIVDCLNSKPNGVVLRQDEILHSPHNDTEFFCTIQYRLEKPFLSVILLALIYSGDIVLNLKGKKYDASNIRDLIPEGVDGISEFSSVSRPQDWNPAVIKSLLALFGEPEGLFNSIKNGEESVVQSLQTKNGDIINELATDSWKFKEGLSFFEESIDTQNLGISDLKGFVEELKNDFESLKQYNNCGKLKNLKKTVDELDGMKSRLYKEKAVRAFFLKTDELNKNHIWFESARNNLPKENGWIQKYEALKQEALDKVRSWDITELNDLNVKFDSLKKEYVKIYSSMHAKARLSGAASHDYAALLQSNLVKKLTKMSRVAILPKEKFDSIYDKLLAIKECGKLREDELMTNPQCPHCNYNPSIQGEEDASLKLKQIRTSLEDLLDSWTESIIENLQDPFNKESIRLMSDGDQTSINDLINNQTIPDDISDDYVKMLDTALKGLKKKLVKKDSVYKQILGDGKPITVKELKDNFDRFIDSLSAGENVDTIRIVLE